MAVVFMTFKAHTKKNASNEMMSIGTWHIEKRGIYT
jgi:hypothetical protein